MAGAIAGLLLGLLGGDSWLVPAAIGALLGAAAGGVLAYGAGSLQRRQFASVRTVRAGCYELVVQSRWAEEARSLVTTWRSSRTPERHRVGGSAAK